MIPLVRVEVGRFDYPVVGTFKFLQPGPDGRVRRPSVLVRLTDGEGYQGWGQAVPIPTWTYETPETVESTLRTYLAPALLGADPADLDDVHDRMNRAIRPAFSVGQPLCKAAIDLACFDLVGKRLGQPASVLLERLSGGRPAAGPPVRGTLTLSWTVASADMGEVEAQLAEGRARGFRHFNIKVGPPQSPAFDVALARKVRAFSPEGFLWADANTGYAPDEAIELARRLADAGVDVLESPLPPTAIRGYQALKRLGALPILMDEGILSPVEAIEFAALGMFDGIALKPARNAGLFPSIAIVQALRERGLLIVGSGLTDPDLSLAAAAHLFSWAGIERPCALNGPQFLGDRLSGEALVPAGDQLTVPRGPGLGLT
ncbi:MAG TPA: enolase C-terminal domain-like protein, partial [Limnochordia bacterium]